MSAKDRLLMNRSMRSSAVPGRSLGNRWPVGVVVVGGSGSMGMGVVLGA